MKKTLIAAAISAGIAMSAFADTSNLGSGLDGIHGVLENDYVRAGVNSVAGTFGSGGNTSPGLLYDSTGTGTFNTSYDYLTPGSPFDGFSVMIDGTNYSNNNGRAVDIEGDATHYGTGSALDNGTNILRWYGVEPGQFEMQNLYFLGATSEHIEIETNIYMKTDATDVWFSRHIDPDARAADGDSSSTDNVLGYGVIPDSNVAFSEALESRYALGLYSTDSNVDAGISSWSQNADAYTYNAIDGEGDNTNTGDNTIGLSWHWSSVANGDILIASYAYIFGPSAFDASVSVAENCLITCDSDASDAWGTLEDVGDATSAAEASSTPVKTYDYSSATYSDSSYIVTTPWAYHLNTNTGLYDSGSMTIVGADNTFTVTRTSDVPYTSSDSSTGSDEISETFSRIVTGSGTATMSGYTVGDKTRVSQGLDTSTLQETYTGSAVEVNNQGVITLGYSGSIDENFTATTPYTYTYNRTVNRTSTDDFAADSGYTDGSSSETITDTYITTIDHVATETDTHTAGMTLELRTDVNQEKVITDINRSINRGMTFGEFRYQRFDSDYGLYSGKTNMISIGNEKQLDNGITVGFGFNNLTTSVNGETSKTDVDTKQFGITVSQNINNWDLQGTVQHSILDIEHSNSVRGTLTAWADDDYISYSENIPVGADLSTSGTHSSVSLMAKGPGGIIRPIVGGTYGKEKVDGARKTLIEYNGTAYHYEIEEVNKDYGYATVGAEISKGPLTVNALHHTDGVNQLSASIDYSPKENVDIGINTSRTMTDLGDTNSVSLGMSIKF